MILPTHNCCCQNPLRYLHLGLICKIVQLKFVLESHVVECSVETEVNLSAFVYILLHDNFFAVVGTNLDLDLFQRLTRNLHEEVCKQMQIN